MGLRDSLKVDPCEYITISATGAPFSAALAKSQKNCSTRVLLLK